MKSGKTFLGIIAGFATGALVGVLFAPEKGSKIRKKIARKGEDFMDSINEKYLELKDGVAHSYSDAKSEVKTHLNNGKTKINELTKDNRSNLD